MINVITAVEALNMAIQQLGDSSDNLAVYANDEVHCAEVRRILEDHRQRTNLAIQMLKMMRDDL